MRLLVLTALLAAVTACAPAYRPPPAPTAEASLAYLNQVVALVMAGNVRSICDLGGGGCDLPDVDPTTVPTVPPRVVGTQVLTPRQNPDGTWGNGGRVLQLCGTDGKGQRYYSEMLVFSDGQRLISVDPVFWTGVRVATSSETSVEAMPAVCA